MACPLHDRRFALATGAPLTDGPVVRMHRVLVRGDSVTSEIASELAEAA